jgi:hypothetical protein
MQFSDISLFDPYKLETVEYEKVMKNIRYIAEKIDLERY